MHGEVLIGFAAEELPSGLALEAAALRAHVGGQHDAVELRRAVQLCSVGLGETTIHAGGVPMPAAAVVERLDLEPFVQRRIRGWAGLN